MTVKNVAKHKFTELGVMQKVSDVLKYSTECTYLNLAASNFPKLKVAALK